MSVYVVRLPALRVLGQNGRHYNARMEVRTDDPHRLVWELRLGTPKEKFPLATTGDITPNELKQIAAELAAIADQLVTARETTHGRAPGPTDGRHADEAGAGAPRRVPTEPR